MMSPHQGTVFHETLSINELLGYGLAAPAFGVRYHQQDNHGSELYCGAACAQIVLASIEAGMIDQNDLYASFKAASDPDPGVTWFSQPDGIARTLNERKPESFTDAFTLWALESEEAIARKLCWAIMRGVAPITLTVSSNSSHWVVISGFTASAQPVSSTDTAYQILSFDVYDPWPPTPGPSDPPPHRSDGSDFCGAGTKDGVFRGDEFLTVEYTNNGITNAYLNRVPTGRWQGTFLAICDQDPPAEIQGPPAIDDDTIVTDLDEIKGRARRGPVDRGQNQRRPLITAIGDTREGEPLLVEREDMEPPRYYYLVPFFSATGDAPFVALIDAYASGGAAGSIASPGGTTHFSEALDRATVIETFAGTSVDIGGETVMLLEEDLHENLVWRPCGESLSPYWPFYRFDIGGPDSQTRAYVRIDGTLFPELHDGWGM